MTQREIALVIGSLLHDYGKLLFRYNDTREHSLSGYEALKSLPILEKHKDILNCVAYHHAKNIKSAKIEKDDICYITYIADNIAAAGDRRGKDDNSYGFVRDIAQESIFNILNGNDKELVYNPGTLSDEINYPCEDKGIVFDDYFYGNVVLKINESLNALEMSREYINSLLSLLEAELSFIPSSTQIRERRDISLYDHVKLTAAFASCIELYLKEKNITDYEEYLFKNADKFYKEKAFALYSLDVSGIQSFIYNIADKNAQKNLRARSFYLEILLEHIADELLQRLSLSRANIMYTGGGHTYIFVPNSISARDEITSFEKEINRWLLKTFKTELFLSGGFCECCAEDFYYIKGKDNTNYKKIFETVSGEISKKKLSRYSAEDILFLNSPRENKGRECVICHSVAELDENNICSLCNSFNKLASSLIANTAVFVVQRENDGIPLPFDCYLKACFEQEAKQIMKTDKYVRSYGKNRFYTGFNMSANIWTGDYCSEKELEKMSASSEGIDRIGVIRADIDDLGKAFVSGFSQTGNGKYETISRSAVFSRKISMFFKFYINSILKNGKFDINTGSFTSKKQREAVIVYSGGDDLFIVGGWDDIIAFSVDLYDSFKKYTCGTLTFSAGIGIFDSKYPISAMARYTGELEDIGKHTPEKNCVTLFDKDGTYSWEVFINCVLNEKLRVISDFLSYNTEKGKAMLYKMLSLIRGANDKLNIAKFAYLMGRMRDEKHNSKQTEESYNYFCEKMYDWIQNKEDRRELVTAIYIYVYLRRETNGS